jgi:hypothetical protein
VNNGVVAVGSVIFVKANAGSYNKYIMSGFSGGIIEYAKFYPFSLDLLSQTIFKSYRKSFINNYRYKLE